jgi:UPF0148 protein
MKNPDEIMAEYLLKGAKMLAEACQICGTPLFEYEGETICVICRGREGERSGELESPVPGEMPAAGVSIRQQDIPEPSRKNLAEEIERTLMYLCERVRNEQHADDCLVLMECIQAGVDALTRL